MALVANCLGVLAFWHLLLVSKLRFFHYLQESYMKKLVTMIFAGIMTVAAASALAADSMGKDAMSQDSMKKDSMSKDDMKKDSMAKDGMKKDSMTKDEMKKDAMGKDTMGK